MNPAEIRQLLQHGVADLRSGKTGAAEESFRRVLSESPDQPDALHLLGLIAGRSGRHDAGVDLIRRAIAARPGWAEAFFNLGYALERSGKLDEAVAAYIRAVEYKPDFFEAMTNLGNALGRLGHFDDAAAAYRRAIEVRPGVSEAHCNLSAMLNRSGRHTEAIPAAEAAIALRTDYAKAYHNLGVALAGTGRVDAAVESSNRAMAIDPCLAEAHANLGAALLSRGQWAAALDAYRKALELNPTDPAAESTLIFAMHYAPGVDSAAIAAAQSVWNIRHAKPLEATRPAHTNNRDAGRRLRIGYVSADFRDHPVGRFLLPLLVHDDRQKFESFAYSQVRLPDRMTATFQDQIPHWRDIVGKPDPDVADRIRRDRIDILVDLGMHTADNRLPVFARRPAPVQVCWLAFPGSTGLTAMDYRITDPYLDPPGFAESFCTEKTVVLPHTFGCFDPMEDAEIPVTPLPAGANGFVTFGCLNTARKLNEPLLSVWAEILRRVPGSRLLIRTESDVHQGRTVDFFGRAGITASRIGFVRNLPRADYIRQYHRIDIALDTFPYSGHTTTCDTLWMGVPVISLIGTTGVGRGGFSILSNIGLGDLAAETIDEYVRTAVELAGNVDRLAGLRRGLRPMMQRSPLMDAPRFARDIEAAFRRMWTDRCGRFSSELQSGITDGHGIGPENFS